MKEYEKIKQLVTALEEDVIKFGDKGNNAAGTRVRKGLQDIKRACQEMRDAVQAAKKGEAGAA
ncbi:MAG: histone H1 [Bacteroidetes bacterium]|nr:histone H1 [Bacteroidota bacterium]